MNKNPGFNSILLDLFQIRPCKELDVPSPGAVIKGSQRTTLIISNVNLFKIYGTVFLFGNVPYRTVGSIRSGFLRFYSGSGNRACSRPASLPWADPTWSGGGRRGSHQAPAPWWSWSSPSLTATPGTALCSWKFHRVLLHGMVVV